MKTDVFCNNLKRLNYTLCSYTDIRLENVLIMSITTDGHIHNKVTTKKQIHQCKHIRITQTPTYQQKDMSTNYILVVVVIVVISTNNTQTFC